MRKNRDTLSIEFHVKGLNTSQEKRWNIKEVKKYILKNKILIPV